MPLFLKYPAGKCDIKWGNNSHTQTEDLTRWFVWARKLIRLKTRFGGIQDNLGLYSPRTQDVGTRYMVHSIVSFESVSHFPFYHSQKDSGHDYLQSKIYTTNESRLEHQKSLIVVFKSVCTIDSIIVSMHRMLDVKLLCFSQLSNIPALFHSLLFSSLCLLTFATHLRSLSLILLKLSALTIEPDTQHVYFQYSQYIYRTYLSVLSVLQQKTVQYKSALSLEQLLALC